MLACISLFVSVVSLVLSVSYMYFFKFFNVSVLYSPTLTGPAQDKPAESALEAHNASL